jgi:HSP20 family protein
MFNLTQHDPFRDMLSLREAMNDLFADSFIQPSRFAGEQTGARLALDMSETENEYVIEASVAGLKPEDLNVTVENNVLTISGEIKREEDKEDKERNYHCCERYYGKFQRSVTLPSTINSDNINATLKDGILRLELPKAEEVKPRRIEVNVGNQLTA